MRLPFIQVYLVEGRTEEQREKLAKAITEATVEILGVAKENVWVHFVEMRKTDFATGGVLRSKRQG